MPNPDALEPPHAKKVPTVRLHHGDAFTDNYEWLRDRDDPEVLEHLGAENDYALARTEHLADVCERVFDEIKSRVKETDLSLPVREGNFWYYGRTFEGKQYGVSCRAPLADPNDWTPPQLRDAQADRPALPGEEVIFDSNKEAEGTEFFALGGLGVSEDEKLLAYAVDTEGDERYILRFRTIATGENFAESIDNTNGGGLFSLDGRFFFYTTVDDSWRPDTVWRHELGTDPTGDTVVFREEDERFWVGLGMTRSKRYIEISVGSAITSETWLLPASDPLASPTVVWPRREGIEYDVEHAVVAGVDRLLITHNENAVGFELVDIPADNPTATPRVLIPHDPAVRLGGVDAFADRLVIEYRRDGLTRLGIVELHHKASEPLTTGSDAKARTASANATASTTNGNSSTDTATKSSAGKTADSTGAKDPAAASLTPATGLAPGYGPLVEIEFDEPLYTVGLGANPEWHQPVLRLGYGSMVTPGSVFAYNPSDGGLTLLKQQEVLGDYSPGDYEQRREWATASDGTRVPISLVWRKDAVTPGQKPAPLLLYGYGAYEISIDPSFAVSRLSLLDRGVIYAVAHVRGGGEMGRPWYEHGKMLEKCNTFTDFIACAQHLIDTGWTAPNQLVAEGGSAGGLLMGAVANLAPELFSGILADVPFVDALTSMLDPELPLTVTEWDEWGDPLHDAQVYRYMRSYSPYENVREQTAYPPILAVTSLNDTRVLYVEPAKWIAKLREAGHDALLKIELVAGHGGVSGRYNAWRDRAFELAWLLDRLGLSAHNPIG